MQIHYKAIFVILLLIPLKDLNAQIISLDKLLRKQSFADVNTLAINGTLNFYGHFKKPYDFETVQIKGVYTKDEQSMQITIGDINNSNNLEWKVKNDTICFSKNINSLLDQIGTIKDFYDYSTFLFPQNVISFFKDMNAHNLILSFEQVRRSKDLILFIEDKLRNKYHLVLNRKNFELTKLEVFNKDEIWGTIRKEVVWQSSNGLLKRTEKRHDNVYSVLEIKPLLGPEKNNIQEAYCTQINSELFTHPNVYLDSIGSNLFSANFSNYDSRSMVIVCSTYIVICDAPGDEKSNEKLSKILKLRFPGKPIKYVLCTHHHPDHIRGIKYFSKQGATVVTTQGSFKYFNSILNDNALSLTKKNIAEIQIITDRTVFHDSVNEIEIYPFVENGHTDEYLIFYLPFEKILVEGDLAWFENGYTKKFSLTSRPGRLFKFIQQKGLDVKHIFQVWPVKNQKFLADFSDLQIAF